MGAGSLDRGVILGTAGHIDHGKTALVRALTGVDTDRLPEEKRRGITIDLGFAPFEVGRHTIGVVDVPGHEAFLRTMLAGASGMDMALLVVAADEGIMPQTREHLEILSLLGITNLLVALTKTDLVDDEWLALQRDEVAGLVNAHGFEHAQLIAVSAKTGDGIALLKEAIGQYAELVAMRIAPSADLFRMPIDRVFTVKGTGTVVTGTVWSGELRKDATVLIRPGSRSARVRAIQHHGHSSDTARPGQRSAVALVGVEVGDVERGQVLVSDAEWVATREIEATVELNREDIRITSRTRVEFHVGTSEATARIVFSSPGEGSRGKFRRARIHFAEPLLVRGLDRFVLRLPSPARTIGGGTVVDAYPDRRTQRAYRAPRDDDAVALDRRQSAAATCDAIVSESGARGVLISELSVRTGLSPDAVLKTLVNSESVTAGGRAFAESSVKAVASRVEKLVADSTANHRLEEGVSLQAIRAAVKAADVVIEIALDSLVKGRRLERSASLIRPANWKPELDARDNEVSEALLHEISKQASEPPSIAELAGRFGGKTIALLRKLEREGKLERVSEDRYYSSEAVKGILIHMKSRLEAGQVYSPAELREVLGVSRKYLIPFLEFCDRSGVTERRQEGRVLR